MSRFFVSGSNLQWIDAKAGVTRSLCGAVPQSVPVGFDGQQPGRIWVASDHRDDNLYYSDGGGQTRFIEGIDKGTDNTLPAGRVYTNEDCATPTELWWATPSGSSILVRSARAEGVRESFVQTAVWRWAYQAFDVGGSNSASLVYTGDNRGNNPLTNAVTVAGTTIKVYSNLSSCQTNATPLATLNPGSLTLSANTTIGGFVAIGVNATSYSGNAFRLETGSNIVGTVDGNNYAPYNAPLCNGNTTPSDYIVVRFLADGQEPGVCYLARTSTPNVNTCNNTCYTGPGGVDQTAECGWTGTGYNSADGCTRCSGVYGVNGGQGICYNPGSPPPPPPPPSGGCGASCTPKTESTVCFGACPICCNGTCSSKCVS